MRGFGEDLARALQRLATQEQISLNQAALRFLRRGAGLPEPQATTQSPRRPIEDLFGAWTQEDADAIGDALSDFGEIDAEMWK